MSDDVQPVPEPERPGIAALAAHARWLLDQHDKRTEGVRTRAIGLLGVVGVTLGLVFTASKFGTGTTDATIKALTIATVAILLGTALLLVGALNVVSVSLPSVNSAREIWSQYAEGSIGDARVAALLANDFLGEVAVADPLTSAADAATGQVRFLRWAIRALILAYAALAALVLVVVLR